MPMNVYNKFDLHYCQQRPNHVYQQAFVYPDYTSGQAPLSPRHLSHHTIRGGLEATVPG